jgi:hypothetical protein
MILVAIPFIFRRNERSGRRYPIAHYREEAVGSKLVLLRTDRESEIIFYAIT